MADALLHGSPCILLALCRTLGCVPGSVPGRFDRRNEPLLHPAHLMPPCARSAVPEPLAGVDVDEFMAKLPEVCGRQCVGRSRPTPSNA